jgi:hypothetical protein
MAKKTNIIERIRRLSHGTMENLFERIVELLGKTPDDPHSRQFVRELGEKPVFEGAYFFKKTGFCLVPEKHVFTGAAFRLRDWEDEPNTAYIADLPFGIQANDHEDLVREKIGLVPDRCKTLVDNRPQFGTSYQDEYDLATYTLRLTFDAEHKLSSIAAVGKPAKRET